jgi:hypothetical protein
LRKCALDPRCRGGSDISARFEACAFSLSFSSRRVPTRCESVRGVAPLSAPFRFRADVGDHPATNAVGVPPSNALILNIACESAQTRADLDLVARHRWPPTTQVRSRMALHRRDSLSAVSRIAVPACPSYQARPSTWSCSTSCSAARAPDSLRSR